MSQEWIVNVLQDLRNFANQNQLDKLAEHLDDTIHVAVAETSAKARILAATEGNAKSNRSVSGTRRAM